MALDASSSVHESLLTGYVQQSVNFIQICQANISLPLFDKIHCMQTTFEVAENQHQYTLDSILQVSNENMKNVELDNIDY